METDKNWKDVIGRPESYVTTNLKKKKRVEINERRATPVERDLMKRGNFMDAQEFLKEKVVKAKSDKELENVKPEDVIKMICTDVENGPNITYGTKG